MEFEAWLEKNIRGEDGGFVRGFLNFGVFCGGEIAVTIW
jgi:hypothetical protein